MKVAIVGCGGIGSVAACAIFKNIKDVVCIEGSSEIAERLNNSGIKIGGKKGNHFFRIKALNEFGEDEKYDVIVFAVKNNVLRELYVEAGKHLTESGFVITLENGVQVVDLHREFPEIKVIPGAVGYNSIMLEHGRYNVTSEGGITLGAIDKRLTYEKDLIKRLFEPLIRVDFSDNIVGVLWAKLLIVCGVTGLGGISGMRVGDLLRLKVARKLFYKVITEGVKVAERLGIKIEKFQGGINPKGFRENGGFPLFIKYIILKIIGKKYRDLKSNIHHSLERGEKTEVDFLNGAVVNYGENLGIDTPVNREILRLTKEIEAGQRNMTADNLYQIENELRKEL